MACVARQKAATIGHFGSNMCLEATRRIEPWRPACHRGAAVARGGIGVADRLVGAVDVVQPDVPFGRDEQEGQRHHGAPCPTGRPRAMPYKPLPALVRRGEVHGRLRRKVVDRRQERERERERERRRGTHDKTAHQPHESDAAREKQAKDELAKPKAPAQRRAPRLRCTPECIVCVVALVRGEGRVARTR